MKKMHSALVMVRAARALRWGLALAIVAGAVSSGCSSHVTRFVRAVAPTPNGGLSVTTCTLDEDAFTHTNDVDEKTCETHMWQSAKGAVTP